MRWVIAILASMIVAAPVWSDGITYYEDFDSYGSGVICYSPQRNQQAFTNEWPAIGTYMSLQVDFDYDGAVCPDGFRGYDTPFYVESGKDASSQNYKYLVPMIQLLDPGMNAVNGSDANPLELKLYVNMKDNNQKEQATSFWVQLFAGGYEDMVPNDSEQLLIHADCVLTNVTPSTPKKSIAFGGYPNLLPCGSAWPTECDPRPECQEPDGPALLDTDVFYDGDHWVVLREDFPVPGLALMPVAGACWWTITIKTDTVDIQVEPIVGGTVTRIGIPRAYTGPFQSIALGAGANTDFPAYIDKVSLLGGYLTTLGGACCIWDGSCTYTSTEGECTTTLGGTWNGVGSTCASVICCPERWMDLDDDSDVDQMDFGQWQLCFSGDGHAYAQGCECFDRDDATGVQGGDGDIDADDFVWFENCVTGPTVLLDVNNWPPGCIP